MRSPSGRAMGAILSFDPTATSMETTKNGYFATSFSVMLDSLEYAPGSRSPKRRRARNERWGAGWSFLFPAEKSPLAPVGLMAGGTKSAVESRDVIPGVPKSRTSMYGFARARVDATAE